MGGSLSVSVVEQTRPLRLGLVVDPTDESTVLRGVGIATSNWSGANWPMIGLDKVGSGNESNAAGFEFDLDGFVDCCDALGDERTLNGLRIFQPSDFGQVIH